MADKRITNVVQPKYATSEEWAKAINFTPKNGEIIIYKEKDGTSKIKIGDGSNKLSVLQFLADEKAPKESPVLTGTPTAPTASVGTNTTQIATTEFVETATQAMTDAQIDMICGELSSDENFVPIIYAQKQISIPYASEIVIDTNTLTSIGELTGVCSITFSSGVEGYNNEWSFIITQGDTAYDVVLPIIKWIGDEPTFSRKTITKCKLYYLGEFLCGETVSISTETANAILTDDADGAVSIIDALKLKQYTDTIALDNYIGVDIGCSLTYYIPNDDLQLYISAGNNNGLVVYAPDLCFDTSEQLIEHLNNMGLNISVETISEVFDGAILNFAYKILE